MGRRRPQNPEMIIGAGSCDRQPTRACRSNDDGCRLADIGSTTEPGVDCRVNGAKHSRP